jgi:hypothetical protein
MHHEHGRQEQSRRKSNETSSCRINGKGKINGKSKSKINSL